jgi:hypothetical protein
VLDRERVARVLAMIGSAHDGEALNAARLAHQLVKSSGSPGTTFCRSTGSPSKRRSNCLPKTTRCATSCTNCAPAKCTIPTTWTAPENIDQQIDQAAGWTAVLTDWEREFVTSIAGRSRLTIKQRDRLDLITQKIARIARANGIV